MDKHDNGKKAIEELIVAEIIRVVSDQARGVIKGERKITSPFEIIGDTVVRAGARIFTTEMPNGLGKQPFETLVHHKNYGHEHGVCNLICVEAYDDRDQAMLGHERWCKELKDNLPKELKDIKNELTWKDDDAELIYPHHDDVGPGFTLH